MFRNVEINDTLVCSKVCGRRNWLIKTCQNRAYLYSWGNAKRQGQLSASLMSILEFNIRFLEFTYKKDAFETAELLKNLGYEIIIEG